MHRRFWLFAVPLALSSLSGTAAFGRGGTRVAVDVTVTTNTAGDLVGAGALGTVRNDPNVGPTQNKSLGCWIDSSPGSAMVTCEAITNDGQDLRCSSANAVLVATAATMQGDSMISFITPGSPMSPHFGECIEITVDNNSMYAPKVLQ